MDGQLSGYVYVSKLAQLVLFVVELQKPIYNEIKNSKY